MTLGGGGLSGADRGACTGERPGRSPPKRNPSEGYRRSWPWILEAATAEDACRLRGPVERAPSKLVLGLKPHDMAVEPPSPPGSTAMQPRHVLRTPRPDQLPWKDCRQFSPATEIVNFLPAAPIPFSRAKLRRRRMLPGQDRRRFRSISQPGTAIIVLIPTSPATNARMRRYDVVSETRHFVLDGPSRTTTKMRTASSRYPSPDALNLNRNVFSSTWSNSGREARAPGLHKRFLLNLNWLWTLARSASLSCLFNHTSASSGVRLIRIAYPAFSSTSLSRVMRLC